MVAIVAAVIQYGALATGAMK